VKKTDRVAPLFGDGVGMKRWIPLTLVALIAPLGVRSTGANAASHPSASKQVLSHLLQSEKSQIANQLRGRQSLSRLLGSMNSIANKVPSHTMLPLGSVHAPANASASDLALPSDLVSKSYASQGSFGSGQGPFSNYHHSWSGFQSGIAASFDFEPIMTLFYAGSVFSSSGSASAFMSDSYNSTQNGSPVSPTDCSGSTGVPCKITGFTTTTGKLALYSVAQVNYCVIETGFQGDGSLITDPANSDNVSSVTADTFLIGVNEAKAACTGSSPNAQPQPPAATPVPPVATPVPPVATPVPPTVAPVATTSFHIVSVQLLKNTPSGNTIPTALSKVKVGKKAVLYTLMQVTSGRTGLSATYSFNVKTGSKTVVNKTMSGALHSPNAAGNYQASLPVKFSKRGTYVFTETITVDGIAQSGAASFQVVK
jgi:hypothetical protein